MVEFLLEIVKKLLHGNILLGVFVFEEILLLRMEMLYRVFFDPSRTNKATKALKKDHDVSEVRTNAV